MIAYRITAERYAGDISGIGAEKYGGRWNRRGKAVVYACFSRALALLELLVNLKAPQDFSCNYTFTVIEVEDIDIVEITTELLRSFGAGHHYEASRTLADDCWQRLNGMGISVPSAVLPYESNLVLNVQHPEFAERVKVLRTEPFEIESRLQ